MGFRALNTSSDDTFIEDSTSTNRLLFFGSQFGYLIVGTTHSDKLFVFPMSKFSIFAHKGLCNRPSADSPLLKGKMLLTLKDAVQMKDGRHALISIISWIPRTLFLAGVLDHQECALPGVKEIGGKPRTASQRAIDKEGDFETPGA